VGIDPIGVELPNSEKICTVRKIHCWTIVSTRKSIDTESQTANCALENAKLSKKSKSEDTRRPKNTRFTRAAAIRLKCIDCSAYQKAEIRKCYIKECSLWD